MEGSDQRWGKTDQLRGLPIDGSTSNNVRQSDFHGVAIEVFGPADSDGGSVGLRIQCNTFAVSPLCIDCHIQRDMPSVQDSAIQNNIFYEVQGTAARVRDATLTNVAVDHNMAYRAATTQEPGPAGMMASSNWDFADPVLEDPGAQNYHLLATSPALDVGVAAAEVRTDHDGVCRPQGVGWDLGALERVVP